MLHLYCLLITAVKKKQVTRIRQDNRVITSMLDNTCSCCSSDRHCILNSKIDVNNLLDEGPKIYHSCIEKTHVGLLFRVLHSITYYSSDEGHIYALNFHTNNSIYEDKILCRLLYQELKQLVPSIEAKTEYHLRRVSDRQYNTFASYLVDKKHKILRDLEKGKYRVSNNNNAYCKELSRSLPNIATDKSSLNNELLDKCYIYSDNFSISSINSI